MITYKSLANDIKALFLTRNDSFGLKKSDELDLIVETATYNVMNEKSENMFKKFFRYATRAVSTSDKSDSGFVLIDARCNPDLIKEFNAIDPRGNDATCEDIYYNGCTYLIHSMNYQTQEKDEMMLYLSHLYAYITKVVNLVMDKPSCVAINNEGASAYILKYILDDTDFLVDLKKEGYEFIDIIREDLPPVGAAFPTLYNYSYGIGTSYHNPPYIAAKYKKISEDHKLMQSDYITILLDRCQSLTVKIDPKELLGGLDTAWSNTIQNRRRERKQQFLTTLFKEGNTTTEGEEEDIELVPVKDGTAKLQIGLNEGLNIQIGIVEDPTSSSINKLCEKIQNDEIIEPIIIDSLPAVPDSKVDIVLPDANKEDLVERKMSPKYEAIPKKEVIYSNKQNKNNYQKNFNQKQNHRPGNR